MGHSIKVPRKAPKGKPVLKKTKPGKPAKRAPKKGKL